VRALGWKQVEMIDSDLGSSAGIASAQREGFERVLSLVALGEVGIVGSREVSRLSRTDKDWCRLLEVCQIFGTLIADEQQVYDLNYLDDQLVLGIKGTLSVVELKVIRQRLLAGQESKARRGELFKRLPIGYARDPVGKIVFHPDRRICEGIQLVFAKFRELWSVRQTFQCAAVIGHLLPQVRSRRARDRSLFRGFVHRHRPPPRPGGRQLTAQQ
jgi:DNA invertase Pin-like site-specific DNA recombinase